jgi:hypothetical protein
MKSQIISFLIKVIYKSFSLAGMMLCVNASANDGKPSAAAVKGSVPVNYYEAFMIAVAVIYGIYLIIRAKRRKRNGKISG